LWEDTDKSDLSLLAQTDEGKAHILDAVQWDADTAHELAQVYAGTF